MAAILFDMFPAHGHYNGSMALAKLLANRGHEVCYACSSDFQQKVAAQNFKFYLIDPFIVFPFRAELKEKGLLRFLLENISGIFHDQKPRQIEEKVKLYDEMIAKLRPGLIILDEHYAYKSIFYWKYLIPIATIQTALSPDYAPSIPPCYSTYIPQKSKISDYYVELIWNWELIKLSFKKLKAKVISVNTHSGKYNKVFAKKYDFPFDQELIKRRTSGVRFKNIPSLVVPPEAFDFPRKLRENLFYIGPIINEQQESQELNGRLKSILDKVALEKDQNSNVKLIYCSLGTVTAEFLKVCTRFFRHIAKVCSENPNIRIILSVGTFFNISDIKSIPKNLYVFDKVPQLDLLQKCDMVINHGGMNTIYECIMTGKPMVIFPLSLTWDQNGCAARVVYHQIGVRGVIRKSTPKSIAALLGKVIVDEDLYRRNLKKLKSNFVDKSAYTLELIDHILKEGNPQ
jgi:zeaxanthin glucosyltransferase